MLLVLRVFVVMAPKPVMEWMPMPVVQMVMVIVKVLTTKVLPPRAQALSAI